MDPDQNQTLTRRLELHTILTDILGSNNCYFQPPESIKLNYPCIVYHRNTGKAHYADNNPYRFQYSYTVTAITKDPDSDLPRKLAGLPLCRYDRHFVADNLNHDVFVLYY